MTVYSCSGCHVRDLEITRLRGRIGELEQENHGLREELATARREANRQAAPFRRDELKKRKKKPGRHKGHPPANRPTPTPERIDRVVEVPCRTCPDCATELVERDTVIQYQTDLPPIVPIVTQFKIETGYGPCCRQRHQGRHLEQTSNAIGAAGNTLGPIVLTMAAELKHRLGVPYRKICDFLQTYCDISVSPGTLVRAEQRLTQLARPTYDLLIDALRKSEVVHADETGWRISSVNAWLWVFSNQDVTVYAIRSGKGARAHGVPEEILGPDFDGYLIVDGLATYNVLDYKKGQCNAHLLRRAKKERQTASPREQAHLDQLIELIQDAIALDQRRDTLSDDDFLQRAWAMEDRLLNWLQQKPSSPSSDLERLANHVAAHIEEWFAFLFHPDVPPTNNHAERMLRPAVITRKVGGCNKTLLGALVHSVLSSIMVTCKQQGQKFLDLARRLWSEPEAGPIPIPPKAT